MVIATAMSMSRATATGSSRTKCAGTASRQGDGQGQCRHHERQRRQGLCDEVEVSENLRDGIVENLLLVTRDGSRLAADKGQRQGAIYVLEHAAYSPCAVEDDNGCPRQPTWEILADRVVYDSTRQWVRYTNARVRLFGLPVIPLPGLQHSVGDEGASGLLVPDVGYDQRNGFEAKIPYYFRLADNRDLTLTPHLYSGVLPMIEADYRALLSRGAYQITAYGTVSGRTSITDPDLVTSTDRLRGYLSASGMFQFDSHWSATGSLRYVTDQTFLKPLRHQPRGPAALDHRDRPARRALLPLDRGLGLPVAARGAIRRDKCRWRCRRSIIACASPIRCSAGRSSSRPTASPSCARKDRTRSAPSSAPSGRAAV